jgi:endo-1,4-beta-xylanase
MKIAQRALATLAVAAALAAAGGPAAPAAQAEEFNNVPLLSSDFEDGELHGWHGRGHDANIEKVAIATGVAHGGSKSLKISERTTTWQGPQHFLADDVAPGDVFRIGAWLYYDEGPAQAGFVLSVERSFKDPKAEHKYANVSTVTAKKGQWTFLSCDYTVSNDPTQKAIEFYFERPYKADAQITPDDQISFYIDDVSVAKLDPNLKPKVQEDIPNLAETWSPVLAIGAAVTPDNVDPADAHGQLLMKHFGALVAGNAMKWESLQPKEGQFAWADADRIVEFAGLTGMRVRGHCLVWHNQTPAWVFQDPKDPTKPASRELLLKRMKTHIQSVVAHFKGQVEGWDVVNEALSDKDGLRSGAEGNKWLEILGPGYIEQAFRWAREADPAAILTYNDYNLESDSRKLGEALKLVAGLKAKGAPVDAIGLQMHVSIAYPPLAQVQDAIARIAAIGVKAQVTELDVSVYSSDTEPKKDITAELLLAQAQRYKDLFAIFKAAAAKGALDIVVVWGLADDGTWLDDFPVPGRRNAPLLFDRRLQAKPAFWALVEPSKVKGLK